MNAEPPLETVVGSARIAPTASSRPGVADVGAADADPVDIGIAAGRIVRISAAGTLRAGRRVDADGRWVVPAFAEPHLHLDKAMLGAPAGGDLRAAIAATADAKRRFTESDVHARASRVLALALAAGTTRIRAQTELDPGVGTRSVDALTRLGAEHADWLRLQIAAFPQEGLRTRPGTLELMRAVLSRGGDVVVGGCPYTEASLEDARWHVDAVLDLAREHDTEADLHLDLADDTTDPRFDLAGHVARETERRGMQGRVTIGHVTSLASLDPRTRGELLRSLAASRITVVPLPATDLYLTGRRDVRNVRRGVAPLHELWRAGVPTALSSNNVRNAFTPTGLADPLDTALLQARVGHHVGADDFARLLGAVTTDAAAIVEPDETHGILTGASADLVVLEDRSETPPVIGQPARAVVLSRGRVVFEERRERTWSGGAAALSALG